MKTIPHRYEIRKLVKAAYEAGEAQGDTHSWGSGPDPVLIDGEVDGVRLHGSLRVFADPAQRIYGDFNSGCASGIGGDFNDPRCCWVSYHGKRYGVSLHIPRAAAQDAVHVYGDWISVDALIANREADVREAGSSKTCAPSFRARILTVLREMAVRYADSDKGKAALAAAAQTNLDNTTAEVKQLIAGHKAALKVAEEQLRALESVRE